MIHVLVKGYPDWRVRCGGVEGHPSTWPRGNGWVLSEKLARELGRPGGVEPSATCQACLEQKKN
jgi:hypothetical protein